MTNAPGIAVLIPSAHGRAHLETLLPTIAAQTLTPSEIWIADSDTDGAATVAAQFGARFLPLSANTGFASTVNALVRSSSAPYAAVLNNDLRLAPDWLATLAPHLELHPFAAGKLFHWDRPQILDGSFDLLSLSGFPLRAGHGKRDSAFFHQPRSIAFAPWTAVLLRRDFLDQVGPLDESFGSYFEDVDFHLRALALGHTGYYQPRAHAWHRGSSTFGPWHPRQVELSARNQSLLIAKHGGPEWRARWPREFWTGQFLSALAAFRHGQLQPWLRGKLAARCARTAPLNPILAAQLESLQPDLFTASHQGGLDPFWRLYWALTL
jgi:GT2 family glycosyltransferase